MVAITSVVLTLMMFLAGGLIAEHNRFVDNRDTLKVASDAAVVAATQHLHRLPTSMSDSAVEVALEDTARRYAFLVVEGNSRNSPDPITPSDMDITLHLNRAAGVVGVDVATNMRGVLYKQLVSAQGERKMAVRSGAEQEVTRAMLVLALDASQSMHNTIGVRERVDVVRDAAKTMVDELVTGPHVSVGVVPWSDWVCNDPLCDWGWGILAPTNDVAVIQQMLDDFEPRGGLTFSPVALTESTALLENAPADVRRGLVLLTDGEDTVCRKRTWFSASNDDECTAQMRTSLRKDACDAAKEAGITIWVVAAMPADRVGSRLERELRDCASEGEQHVFVENLDDHDLEEAFESIAAQVKELRRTY